MIDAEYAANGLVGLDKSDPSPVASKILEQRQIEKLENQAAKLYRELDTANAYMACVPRPTDMRKSYNAVLLD